jgi:FkbM family methyltransferase
MARDLLGDGEGFNACVRGREGYVVYNRNDVFIGKSLERYGEYNEIEAALLRRLLPKGGTAVEVGANIGTHTLVLARAAGPSGWVLAYEPQRVVFQTLCANIAVNSLMHVEARQCAVGGALGSVTVPEIDYASPGNFGGIDVTSFTDGYPVPLVTLDEDIHPPRLDLLKIDVEGMELEVLRGADALIRHLRPVLYLENDRVERSRELISHLLALDYRLYWHLPPLFNPDNFFGDSENVLGTIVSVNMLALPRERPAGIDGLAGLDEVADPSEHPFSHEALPRG